MSRLRQSVAFARTCVACACTCIGLAGCAQVFGIDETSSGSGDDGGDATLQLQRTSIGATVVRNPLDVTGLTANFLTPARVMATPSATAPDTWTADVTGAPPIEFTLPDVPTPIERIYALDQRTMLGDFDVYEDPNPQAAPDASTFALNVALDKPFAGESMTMYTVGAWSDYDFSAAELPAANATTFAVPTLGYASFTPLGQALYQITNADAVLILKYTGDTLDAVLDATSFTQTSGSNPVTGTMAAVAPTEMAQATIDPTSIPARYSTLTPAFGDVAMTWSIAAAPGMAVASNAGPQLDAGAIAMTDTMITSMYGNPFTTRDWQPVLTFATSAARSYMDGSAAVSLGAGLYQLAVASPTLGTLDLAVGIPTSITLDQMPLAADGMMVTVDPTQPVTLAFTTDQSTNTFYELALTDVALSADMTTVTRTTELIATGVDPTFSVPADYFVVGHTYIVRAAALAGSAPNVAAGDLQTRSLPLAVGYADSAVFTIMP